MIVEFFINVFFGIIMSLLDMIEVFDIRILSDLASVLSQFCVYGGYIVGADLLLLFGGMIVNFSLSKMMVGVAIRIWELLPLT